MANSVSRRFDRPAGSVTGGYIVVEGTVDSGTHQTWTITNGDTTTQAGAAPFSILFTGTYDQLYQASSQNKDDQTTTAPQVYAALPSMLADLLAQDSAGIKSLADLNDASKLAGPAAAGANGGLPGIGSKFADLGSSGFSPSKLGGVLSSGAIKVPSFPKLDSFTSGLIPSASSLIPGAVGQLSGLVKNISSTVNSMTGSGGGKLGVPSLNDIMGPITGQSSAMRLAAIDPTSPEAVAAIAGAVNAANSFFATAGIDLNTPKPNGLKSCMNFATNLHGLGADTHGFGTANMLGAMATDDQYGQAIKAGLEEGKNNAILGDAAGVPPPVHDSPTNYTADREKLENEETKVMAQYDDSPLLTFKVQNVITSNALRKKMLAMDTQYSNDPALIATDNDVINANNNLIASLQKAIARGIVSV